MNIIYSLSSAPYFAKNPGKSSGDFTIEKFELYTAAISSLVRRRVGDRTTMHVDGVVADYLRRTRLAPLWDCIETTIPEDFGGINPRMFWAAGKLFALRAADCPVVMLDADFIAWQLPELPAKGIAAAHREDLSENVYPPITRFEMKDGYEFDKSFSYSPRPLNTAFLYIGDYEFKQFYVAQSLDFMRHARDCGDYLTYMVYAEQRLLAILAEARGIEVKELMEWGKQHQQRRYTHVWGAKQVLRDVPVECERFCRKCRERIQRDFPEWAFVVDLIERA